MPLESMSLPRSFLRAVAPGLLHGLTLPQEEIEPAAQFWCLLPAACNERPQGETSAFREAKLPLFRQRILGFALVGGILSSRASGNDRKKKLRPQAPATILQIVP